MTQEPKKKLKDILIYTRLQLELPIIKFTCREIKIVKRHEINPKKARKLDLIITD